ncbi:hypothetical protein PILCRDRAFT_1032 [Piloderma croceum F 1598]|uniref:UBC core domain-containing protein n=1 Tax=Piloderma croceum (strain F 1598) TaxID=765440 RepID=A0A0C3GJE9_PILCF|nr:hypothetical protein PILCRDRAFT_1032 [Piloderma croceum F 1598]
MLSSLVPSPTIDLGAARAKNRTTTRPTTSSAPQPIDTIASPVTRTAVSLEYASLCYNMHCPLGMYIVPSNENLLVWDAVFFVHQGYYTDSILKFRLTFPASYPEKPPVVQFLTDVFHPLISQQTGVFNLAPRFRPWRPKEHHVFDVLHWVKAAFKKHALDGIKDSDCLNKEAFRYHDTTSSFAALATQSSMLSQSSSALFDRDHPSMNGKHRDGMMFRELKPQQSAALRTKLGLGEWDDEA